jgi:uncharacterized protein with beta-barrel porin domain
MHCSIRILLQCVKSCFLLGLFASIAWGGYPVGYAQAFQEAVQKSMGSGTPDYRPNPEWVVDDLKTIEHSTEGLIWKPGDPNRVLVTAFTPFTGYNSTYIDNRYRSTLWVTPAPDLYNWLHANQVAGDQIALRTKQLLGLPADNTGDRVVEVWADIGGIRRPCKNPDITNPKSSLEFPTDVDTKYPGYRAWFTGNYTNYTADPPIPWTQLGYTYDWGNPDSIRGLNELLVVPFNTSDPTSQIEFYAVYSIGSYPYFNRTTGNFDIVGDCDTVWAGTKYQPYNHGSTVTVAEDATVYQGILINSAGYTVTNHGSILGPGKNPDLTYRAAVLKFDAGGTVVNTGLIAGQIAMQSDAGVCSVDNSGILRGTEAAIRTSSSAADQIVNRGTIEGNVETGGGGDAVTLAGGSVSGNIDGGDGTGVFTVDAAGQTAAVAGNIQNFGVMTVHSGTAQINGQMHGSITVDSGATLGGNVIVKAGNLLNAGTVAPGNSIGAITLDNRNASGQVVAGTGNYAQQAGAKLEIEIQKPLDSLAVCDRIDAQGNVTLAADSVIEVKRALGNGGVFRSTNVFSDHNNVFIAFTTPGTIANQGVRVTTNSDYLEFSFINWRTFGGPNAGGLQTTRKAWFADGLPEGNRKNLAQALDADGDLTYGEFAGVVDELLFMNRAEFAQALPALSPAAYLSVRSSDLRTAWYLAESMSEQLQARRHGNPRPTVMSTTAPLPAPAGTDPVTGQPGDELGKSAGTPEPPIVRSQCTDPERQVFGRPFGIFFDQQNTDQQPGFHAGSVGVQVGVDRVATDEVIAGLGIAYARTDLRFLNDGGLGELSNIRVGPYLLRQFDEWFYDGSLTYGYHDNDVVRDVTVGEISGTPRGSYNSHDVSLYLAGGRDIAWGEHLLTPLGSLQYIYYRQCRFIETDGNGSGLELANNDAHSLRGKIGVQLGRRWSFASWSFLPEFSVGYAHEFLDGNSLAARLAGGTTYFDTDPAGVFRDSAYFGAGFEILPCSRQVLFLRYNGELASGGQFHAVNLGMCWEF